MAASSPISKAGTRSRKPIGSLALMVGIGRPSEPRCVLARENRGSFVAVYIAKVRITVEGPMAQPPFAKAMAPVRVVAPRLVRCMISRSRPQKPMPPNGRWRPSANRSGLSFIARTGTYPPVGRRSRRQRQVHRYSHGSVFTPTIRRRSRGRRIIMAGGTIDSMTALLRQDLAKTEENAPARLAPAPSLPEQNRQKPTRHRRA